MPDASCFDTARFGAHIDEQDTALGRPLVALAVTGSTNDDAIAAARDGAGHGAVWVADMQTRGRGRRGNKWTSPPGENLTCSVLLRPRLAPERVSALTLVVGLAVRAAAQAAVAPALGIKWPNDVVAGRKKLSGILVESQLRGSELASVVVGIGINVRMRAMPEEIRTIATSLALLGADEPTREKTLARVLIELEPRLATYQRHGLVPLLDELRLHDALVGSDICVDGRTGVARGIDERGALLLDVDGTVQPITSGTVERR